ncbi:M23 family metallopeptidase [Rathayibacter sp. VKM Ac-2929]|uniref:M23 family metallopeptidase n=2 Tax=unclassified Rathayibacter TaxID=2609250 RepID=UPI001FB3298B|nr:M23 family metallopeptidase [Rathayibacter sp. VKM Ac-2929]MCJ1675704.1 M23 family metallopeptidase [Rathayibacter sp. VKM Ac-2929]
MNAASMSDPRRRDLHRTRTRTRETSPRQAALTLGRRVTYTAPSRADAHALQQAARAAARPRPIPPGTATMRPRLAGMSAMTLVTMIAVTSSMPAFAVESTPTTTAALAAASEVQPQTFVAAGAVQLTVTRDAFGAEAKPEVLVTAAVATELVDDASEDSAASIEDSGIAAAAWRVPVAGRISSTFGPRPDAPVAGVSAFHKGTDLAAPCGTPVVAATGGTVEEAGYAGSYGNWVLLENSDGIETGYAHNSDLLVNVGDTVAAGDLIALVGSTGASSGCHLHFETRVDGSPVDPEGFMSDLGVGLG